MVTFPPVNGELDVNRLGPSRWEVDEVGVGEVGVGVVDFQLSSGFHMTGFYWEMGWLHQTRIKSPGQGFWGVLEVVGRRYRVQTGGFVGDIGVDGGDGG